MSNSILFMFATRECKNDVTAHRSAKIKGKEWLQTFKFMTEWLKTKITRNSQR